MLDFQEIKGKASYNDVIQFLNLQGTKKGEQWRGKCPACASSTDRALTITAGRGAYCFAAKQGGDILWLISHVRGTGVRQAAQELADHIGHMDKMVTVPPKANEEEKATTNGDKPHSFGPLTYLDHDHEACQVFKDAKSLGIGYAPKGILRGNLAIPLYKDGALAGYLGVPLDTPLTLPKNLKAVVE